VPICRWKESRLAVHRRSIAVVSGDMISEKTARNVSVSSTPILQKLSFFLLIIYSVAICPLVAI
jgi:hypothetical protein